MRPEFCTIAEELPDDLRQKGLTLGRRCRILGREGSDIFVQADDGSLARLEFYDYTLTDFADPSPPS
jgi:hypothetical protein